MTWIWRHRLKVAIGLLVFFFILPVFLGVALRGTVEGKVGEVVKAPVKLGGLKIHLLPPGATLLSLTVGDNDPHAANQPLANVGSVRANVSLGTVFGGTLHVTSLKVSDAIVSVAVDEAGQSSLDKFIQHMGESSRKDPLPIDEFVLRNVAVHTYLAEKLSGGLAADIPDSKLELDYAGLSDLVLPAPGTLLGKEVWSGVVLEGLRLTAPTMGSTVEVPDPVADGMSVGKVSLEMMQAPSPDKPLQIRSLYVKAPQMATVYTQPGKLPALTRAMNGLKLALATTEAPKKNEPEPAGVLISDMSVSRGRIETRGMGGNGKPAYWRLDGLSVEVAQLALGPSVKANGAGYLKAESASVSSSGPGKLLFALNDITGSYPKWNFKCDYKLEGVAAPAFSVAVEETASTKVESGTIAMDFAGPAEDGKLKIDGGVTLSKDFETNGTIARHVAKLTRGDPIRTVRVRGTVDNPKISYPDAFAGVIGNVIENVISGGPLGVLDTAGGFMESAVGQGIRETTKSVQGATEILKKVPGLKSILGN